MTQSANYVDFQVVKKSVSILQILEHYHLADNFKRGGNGDSLTGACPLHKGENPTHFRVSLSKNCWNCFGKCKRGGNILDFVSRMEDCSIREAALRISEWFRLSGGQSPEQERMPSQKEAHRTSIRQTKSGVSEILDENAPNKPLGFELQHLDQEHPYFAERGLTRDTVLAFGLGYCSKGSMAGRIVIPIHNVEGELVAYAGRWPGEPPDDAPKYKLPTGFRKSMEVFNIHRTIEDAPEEPLLIFAAVLRLATNAEDSERAWEIVRGMAGALSSLNHPNGNELIPLRNDEYPLPCHIEDMLHRQSRRSGMLLNSEELLALVHLPSPAVQTPKLVREKNHTKAAPKVVTGERGLLLGRNIYGGKVTDVRLTPEQRVRHTHIIGASGTGKSTLLFNLIRQDIENGEGLAVLDPHGDLVEQVLGIIPPERIQDVVLVDPSDEEFPVGFNILSAHSELEKTLLASDLVSVFQRLSTSWGDQMSSVLHNGILAFLESSEGGTLSDLRRFLLDPVFRNSLLKSVRDPEIVYYWQKGFPQLSGNKSIGPVLTRLETFLSPKPIRYIVSQKENRLDFAAFMDTGKIFLAKLPQGLIGWENAYLLGSLLVSKFQQVAMSRQRQAASGRRDFWIYADEFHHFITPSMAEILSGARKYRVGLVLAHQELRQLQRDAEVASAVLSNCFTRVVFRVGDSDARSLSEGFSSFEARDLQNLEIGEAVCRVERSDFDFNLSVPFSDPDTRSSETRDAVIAASRRAYGKPRSEIEEELFRKFRPTQGVEQETKDVLAADVQRPTEQLSEEHGEPVVGVADLKAAATVNPAPISLPATADPKPEISAPLPKTLGKGGQKHKYLQQFIKQWAQGMGYMAIIEEQVAGGQVDVSLQKNNRKIACEISVTTATEQETGNVKKCLAASFDFVALVVPDEKRVAGFRKALQESLTDSEWLKIRVVTPDELFSFIEELDAKDANRRGTIRGYNVKVNHHAVDTVTKTDRMAQISKVLADSLKRTK
jgi:hypothetical protein